MPELGVYRLGRDLEQRLESPSYVAAQLELDDSRGYDIAFAVVSHVRVVLESRRLAEQCVPVREIYRVGREFRVGGIGKIECDLARGRGIAASVHDVVRNARKRQACYRGRKLERRTVEFAGLGLFVACYDGYRVIGELLFQIVEIEREYVEIHSDGTRQISAGFYLEIRFTATHIHVVVIYFGNVARIHESKRTFRAELFRRLFVTVFFVVVVVGLVNVQIMCKIALRQSHLYDGRTLLVSRIYDGISLRDLLRHLRDHGRFAYVELIYLEIHSRVAGEIAVLCRDGDRRLGSPHVLGSVNIVVGTGDFEAAVLVFYMYSIRSSLYRKIDICKIGYYRRSAIYEPFSGYGRSLYRRRGYIDAPYVETFIIESETVVGSGIAAYEYADKISVSPRIARFCVSGICGAGSRGTFVIRVSAEIVRMVALGIVCPGIKCIFGTATVIRHAHAGYGRARTLLYTGRFARGFVYGEVSASVECLQIIEKIPVSGRRSAAVAYAYLIKIRRQNYRPVCIIVKLQIRAFRKRQCFQSVIGDIGNSSSAHTPTREVITVIGGDRNVSESHSAVVCDRRAVIRAIRSPRHEIPSERSLSLRLYRSACGRHAAVFEFDFRQVAVSVTACNRKTRYSRSTENDRWIASALGHSAIYTESYFLHTRFYRNRSSGIHRIIGISSSAADFCLKSVCRLCHKFAAHSVNTASHRRSGTQKEVTSYVAGISPKFTANA